MAGHHETLVLQLLGNVTRSRARDLDPGLGEQCAGNQHEADVHGRVDGVEEGLLEVQRRRHVIGNTRRSVELSGAFAGFPDTEELDEQVVREAREQHLADEEDVGAQCRLEHNGHVRGVEQADGVRSAHAALAGRLDGDFNSETLQVDDGSENEESSQEVHDIGKVLAVERFAHGTLLIGPGQEQMEQSDNGTLKLRTTTSVDGRGGKGSPDDRLANIRGNKERDTASETIALLKKLIEKNNDQAGNNELNNQEYADTGTKITGLTVETSKNVDTSLTKGKDNSEKLLSSLIQFTIGLEVQVDIDQVGTGEELKEEKSQVRTAKRPKHQAIETYLKNHPRRNNRSNTQFHQRPAITSQHHPQPI